MLLVILIAYDVGKRQTQSLKLRKSSYKQAILYLALFVFLI